MSNYQYLTKLSIDDDSISLEPSTLKVKPSQNIFKDHDWPTIIADLLSILHTKTKLAKTLHCQPVLIYRWINNIAIPTHYFKLRLLNLHQKLYNKK